MTNQEINGIEDANNGVVLRYQLKKREGNIIFNRTPLVLTNFPHDVADKFLGLGEECYFQTDDEVIRKSEIGRDFYLICEGAVSVWRDGIKLATLTKGDVFGELVIFRDHYRIASVRADLPAILLKFNRHLMMDFFSRQGKKILYTYTMNVIEVLRRKLILTNQKVCDLEQRLARR